MISAELRQLSDQQKVPVDLETYIQKLSNSKRRVTIVNEILQNVQVHKLDTPHDTDCIGYISCDDITK